MKPFAPAILAEDRPECPSHVQRNESEKMRPLMRTQPGPTVVRDSRASRFEMAQDREERSIRSATRAERAQIGAQHHFS